MKKHQKPQKRGTRDKTVKTASVLFLTLVFALMLSGAASAGTPLAENQTGTVSGDLYVNTTDGWPSSTQGATNEVTQTNTLPAYTSIDSAMVYVNVYSGSGTSNWPVRTTIKLDGNGDGDYDEPGELLGVEDMNIPGTTDGTVYWLNDHCNRVYSDYQVWYDVKNLITSNNPTLYVKTENMGGDGYDGRIKLLALTVAYNDGDTDQVHYWVLNGQDWINADTSPSTSTFNTSGFNGQVSSATLNTVALSGTDGTYTLNGNALSGNLTETGTYYKEHQWDVASNITPGANTTLNYANVGSSLKMSLATLTIREAVVAAPVADFTADKTSGTAPLTVNFTNTSTGTINTYAWDFNNDGTTDSTDPNPTWIYSTAGTYTVNLTATGPGGTDTETKTNYLTVSAPNRLADTAWPKYQGNNQNTGQSEYNGPSTNTILWTYTNGGQNRGGAVIGADGTIYYGSRDYKIYALNPDGTLKWTYTTGNYINGAPAIASDGTIYVGSYDGKVYALNPDGTLKWSYTTTGSISGSASIASDGTIYIGNIFGKLYALNPDGTLKWSTTLSYIQSSPSIASDGTIYITDFNNVMYALKSDGTLKWTYTVGSTITSSPSIASDGAIYFGCRDYKLYALNPDGTLKWTYTTGGYVDYLSPSIASDGTIYFGSRDKNLYALNPDGTLKWSYTTGGNVYGSATIGSDGTVYFGGYDKNLYALNPDGTLKWSYTTGNYIYGAPAIGLDGTLYIGSFDGKLYAFKDPVIVPVANFSSQVTNGTEGYFPLSVKFKDTSTGHPTSWLWNFGDGTTSTEHNPSHTYTSPGTYTVQLTATNSAGSDDEVKTDYIVLTTPPVPVPEFTVDVTTGEIPLTVHFTDQSTGINISGIAWDFNNDGITDSTDTNPTWTYNTLGTYTVKLTVTNAGGSDDEIKTDYITVNPDTTNPTVSANPVGGIFTEAKQVILTVQDNADPNPVIYYTTDGTDPTTSSKLYTGPINITEDTTLKFIAVDASGNTSPVQSETYDIQDTQAPTVTATQNGTTITLFATDNADPNPSIYYTTDGTNPTTSSTPYSGPFTIPDLSFTVVKFIAVDVSGNTSTVQTETFNTYLSTDILTGYYAEGNVGVKAILYGGYGWFAYNEPGTGTATFTPSSLNIPTGATILSARLYQSWTWRGYPEYTLQFNGNTIPTTTHYVDGNDGQDFYDVTAYFNQNSDNTAVLTATGGCSYGTLLIVVYESSSEPYQKIWVNEGFDILYASTLYGSNPGPGHVYFNNVTTDNIASAQITAIIPSGQGDGDTIIFNGQNFTTTSRIDSTDPAYAYFNVQPALQNGANEIEYPAGGYYSIQNAILTLTMQPADLTINNLQSNNPQVGTNTPVTATVTNNGGTNASNFQVKLYDNNIQVAKTTLASLAAGAALPVSFDWTPTTTGNHILAIITDAGNQITESDENNNLASAEVTVNPSAQPDLLATNLQLPGSPVIGTNNAVTVTVTNLGTVDSGVFVVKLYDNNTQFATVNLAGLAAGVSTDVTFNWTTFTAGNHNLSVIADANQQITEYNEANNQISQQVTASQSTLSDLAVSNLQLPDSPTVAASSQLTATITNNGTVDASAFVVKLYDNNTQIAKINLTGLTAGASTDVTFNWTTYTAGNHNLSIIVDSNQQITEYNENNNQISQAVTVNPSAQPDLTVTDLQLPANPVAGTTYQITATITNLGTVDTAAFAVKLYDNNTQLGKINITSLAAGTSTQVTFNWTPTTGTHNLAIKADANQQITEYNENNNQITQQATVN